VTSYSALPNKLVSAPDGVDYAYREAGQGELPLILLQHFRGNLDSWDPALVDDLAAARRVVAFDNAGVGGSTGITPPAIEQMAHDAIAFLTARHGNRWTSTDFDGRSIRVRAEFSNVSSS
jgi:pimeloyl-ACP methyl ester carboxylesterase